jgi:hypothetical protein
MNDAPVLDQIAGQYEKFLLIILWKFLPDGVTVTLKDIQEMLRENESADPWVLFTHGHKESFDFKCIRESAGKLIAAHEDATNKGRA